MSNVVRLSDGARKTRVLYAGDMEFAKAQFASVAPQLHLVPAATILTAGANAAPVAGDTADIALIDCGAPGVDARAVAEAIRARGLDVPIVLALDPNSTEGAPTRVTAELRVDDYTVKLPGWLARLTSRLEFAIAHHRRRRTLEALQTSAERLRTVVESAPVCLARVARDGTILAMNAACMKMVSAEQPEDILGKSLLSFVDAGGGDGVRQFLDTVSGGQPGSLEFETAGEPGAARVVDTRAVPLAPDAEGRASALLVLRDATERKRLEASITAATSGRPLDGGDREAQERDSLRQQLDAALEECRRMQAERDAVRAEADEARARAAMVDHVRSACTAAEQQLGEIQASLQRVTAERDAMGAELAAVRGQQDAAIAGHHGEREQQRELLQSAEAERANLASRCDALEALVASMEASHAAEREEHATARARADADLQRLQQRDPLAPEREALLASLATLRAQFDEMSASLDATEARHAAEIRDQRAATESAEAGLREERDARVRLAAERDELRAALERAQAGIERLQGEINDARAGRDTQLAEREAVQRALERQIEELQGEVDVARTGRDAQLAERDAMHRALERQVEELQARVNAAIADRDSISAELRNAAGQADGRSQQLQAALEEMRAAREAQMAESEVVRRELLERIDELQARVQAALAERDAVRHELNLALEAATARSEQLQTALDEASARREQHTVEGDDALRRELQQRIEELQERVQSAAAERDALRRDMEVALEAASARAEQLQSALDDMTARRASQAAEGDMARRTLTERVDELQTRLDAVIIDREALERSLEQARMEHAARLQEAAAGRASLQRRLEQRDAEYVLLRDRHTALQAIREHETPAPAAVMHVAAPPAAPPGTHLLDAQAAFREAFQLLSGELQTAVEATRAQHAALLRIQPAGYAAVDDRLREAESECRRLAAERDEREATVRALQAEVEQMIELRREQRKELVRALQQSEDTERRAAAHLAECARLRQMLVEAQTALQRLSKWAANQGARLGASPVAGHRTVSRIEAPASRTGSDDGASTATLETSWS